VEERSGIGLEREIPRFVAEGDMGHSRKGVAERLVDAVFDFEDLAGGQLIGHLDMKINVDVVLHAVGSDGMSSPNSFDFFGNGTDEGGIEAGGIGDNFDAFEKNFVDGTAEEKDNADGKEGIEPGQPEGTASDRGNGEKGRVDVSSGVGGISEQEGAGDLEAGAFLPVGEEGID
jgi:hypothetical protein